MTEYKINTLDICAQGFERLRTPEEFILTAYVSNSSTKQEIISELHQDINACMREDEFDYDTAKSAVSAYLTGNWEGIEAQLKGLDDKDEDELDIEEGCILFLYVEPC
jgi:hypothetical protein